MSWVGVPVLAIGLVLGAAECVPAGVARDPVLVGAWYGTEGALEGLVLSRGARWGRFFADRRVVCGALACPPRRLAGTWSARAGRLVLRPRGARRLLLRYRVEADRLMLSRPGADGPLAPLERVTTYCAAARDCVRQDYLRPHCLGEDVCEARTCVWRCASCDGYRCVDGEHCEIPDGRPQCVPESRACLLVRCPSDRPHCVAVDGEVACLPPDECHRDGDCPRATTCQPEFVCVRAPCFAPLVCR
jgi:hypothetical protein